MNTLKNVQNYAFTIARSIGCSAYVVCVVNCFREYIGDFVICFGSSMEPTISSEHVLITESFSIRKQKLNRGDIVISKNPYDPKHYICKRVKGISGDKVRYGLFSEIIPKGHVWLEGDNKYNSLDSRNYGPVPMGLLTGRVVFIIWPLYKFRKFTKNEEHSS